MSNCKETRCMECPFIWLSNKLEYYPVYYCKANGQEVHFCGQNGWDRMNWCPLKKDDDEHG